MEKTKILTNTWMSELSEAEQKDFRRSLKLPITKDIVYYVRDNCFDVKDLLVAEDKGEFSTVLIKVPFDTKLGEPSTYQYLDEEGDAMIVRIMCAYLVEMQQANYLGSQS